MKNIVFSWFILPVRNAVMLREFLDEEIVLGVLFAGDLVMLTENLISVPCSDHTWEDDHAAKMFHHPRFQDSTVDGAGVLQLPLPRGLLCEGTLILPIP